MATKCFFPAFARADAGGLSRKRIVEAVGASLRRLRLDHIDLMQCHRFDPDTPLEEIVLAMSDLVTQGRVLYWGVSRFEAPQMAELQEVCGRARGRTPIANQYFYHLLNRTIEREVLPACERLGWGLLAYSPLAQGVLTGKYGTGAVPSGTRGASETARKTMWELSSDSLAKVERLLQVARDAGLTLPELALAFCLDRPGVASVLVGASRPEQILANVRASGVALGDDVREAIDRITLAPGARHGDSWMTTKTLNVTIGDHKVNLRVDGEIAFGEDELLLAKDDNLIAGTPWAARGFSVERFLHDAAYDGLVGGIERLLLEKLDKTLGRKLPRLELERYHDVVATDEDHMKLVNETREGFPLERVPVELHRLEARISGDSRRGGLRSQNPTTSGRSSSCA